MSLLGTFRYLRVTVKENLGQSTNRTKMAPHWFFNWTSLTLFFENLLLCLVQLNKPKPRIYFNAWSKLKKNLGLAQAQDLSCIQCEYSFDHLGHQIGMGDPRCWGDESGDSPSSFRNRSKIKNNFLKHI